MQAVYAQTPKANTVYLYFSLPYVFMRVSFSEPGAHLLARLADQ